MLTVEKELKKSGLDLSSTQYQTKKYSDMLTYVVRKGDDEGDEVAMLQIDVLNKLNSAAIKKYFLIPDGNSYHGKKRFIFRKGTCVETVAEILKKTQIPILTAMRMGEFEKTHPYDIGPHFIEWAGGKTEKEGDREGIINIWREILLPKKFIASLIGEKKIPIFFRDPESEFPTPKRWFNPYEAFHGLDLTSIKVYGKRDGLIGGLKKGETINFNQGIGGLVFQLAAAGYIIGKDSYLLTGKYNPSKKLILNGRPEAVDICLPDELEEQIRERMNLQELCLLPKELYKRFYFFNYSSPISWSTLKYIAGGDEELEEKFITRLLSSNSKDLFTSNSIPAETIEQLKNKGGWIAARVKNF